jgi:hypothetical protein
MNASLPTAAGFAQGDGSPSTQSGKSMRGYFAIGAEGISKAMNLGSLMRSAHAFGASFLFTVAAAYSRGKSRNSDVIGWQLACLPLRIFAVAGKRLKDATQPLQFQVIPA